MSSSFRVCNSKIYSHVAEISVDHMPHVFFRLPLLLVTFNHHYSALLFHHISQYSYMTTFKGLECQLNRVKRWLVTFNATNQPPTNRSMNRSIIFSYLYIYIYILFIKIICVGDLQCLLGRKLTIREHPMHFKVGIFCATASA